MIFTPNQLLQPHADPTFLVQFAVIYNFSAGGILVRCVPEVIQKFPIQDSRIGNPARFPTPEHGLKIFLGSISNFGCH